MSSYMHGIKIVSITWLEINRNAPENPFRFVKCIGSIIPFRHNHIKALIFLTSVPFRKMFLIFLTIAPFRDIFYFEHC